MKSSHWLALLPLAAILAGCGSILPRQDTPVAVWKSEKPAVAASKGGGYYLNDGPGDNPPANLDAIPDAVPKAEPLNKATSRPYTVLGQTYTPSASLKPYKETGVASWYGRRYHGQKTSTGEIYDMYAMTAAHTTLPLPSYARVTNLKNNKSVVVRVNDRGPFHSDRLIDLSYTAAYKLGVLAGGSTPVLVESIDPANYSAAPVYAAAPKQVETIPVVAAAQPVAAPIEAAAGSGHFVQIGAFGMQENAEHFRDRLKIELAQLSDKLQIYSADGLFRVRAGPYPSIAEASQIASTIRNSLNIKAVMTTR
ncbi:MAG: septal ring lytic transglycosylase RlpA family protein [Betaproteobacteria bacterium]|nr:septal ring lytic transglycosylase RlpA family protein [Betaproteobacteria bacterium]